MLTKKDICTSKYFFIQYFLIRFCVFSKIRSYFREYTGIRQQTNAGAPIIGAIMIAKIVLAALVISSCEKPMIWFP